MDHLNANMEGEIVEGEIVEGEIVEAMEGEIAETMEGEIAEAMEGEIAEAVEGGAVEAVGDAIGGRGGEAQAGVNEEALGELATREVSKVFRLSNGSGPTLLRAAGDLLVQCGRNRLPCGARACKTVYFEESLMVALKKKGGGAREGRTGILKALRLKNPGVASGHMAASTFMLPRWLRDVARAGLRNHYTFDLENCHPTLIAARHDSAFLKNFVAERNAILAKTHPDRTAAKELYLRLLYGGSIENWVTARDDDLSDDGLRARVSEDGESSGCRGLLEEPRRTEAAEKRDCPTPRAPLLRFEHRTGEGAH